MKNRHLKGIVFVVLFMFLIFPFRLFGVGNPNIDWGKNALEHRWDKGDFGWRQDDIFMAYLGLTEQARNNLVARSKNFDKNSRFPAFWGPNYDWTPDQDHGGVLMKAFQSILLQADPYSKLFDINVGKLNLVAVMLKGDVSLFRETGQVCLFDNRFSVQFNCDFIIDCCNDKPVPFPRRIVCI